MCLCVLWPNIITMLKLQNYINGELIEPLSNQYLDNYEPATGNIYCHVPDSDEKDINLAVAAARAAFEGWKEYRPGRTHDAIAKNCRWH